jgi:hypothetical protein
MAGDSDDHVLSGRRINADAKESADPRRPKCMTADLDARAEIRSAALNHAPCIDAVHRLFDGRSVRRAVPGTYRNLLSMPKSFPKQSRRCTHRRRGRCLVSAERIRRDPLHEMQSGQGGAALTVYLLDREPILQEMTDCDRFAVR